MTNAHIDPRLRRILAGIAQSHANTHEELGDTIALLNRLSGASPAMPKRPVQYVKDIRICFEQPPIPMRQWDWRALHDGDDEEPHKHGWGHTAQAALADLERVDREFAESLESEDERLLAEHP